MRVLIVTMSLPYPPASGGAIRVHGIVEGLHHEGHDITLLCFHEGTVDLDHIRVETVPYPGRAVTDRLRDLLLTPKPDIQGRYYVETFAQRLRQLLAETKFDLIQFEGIESVCYLPLAKAAQPTAKLSFDTFNAEFELQRTIYHIDRKNIKRWPAALYSYLQIGRIKRFEGEMCRLADAVIAVSQEDANILKQFRDDGCIHVINNGIWVERYSQKDETRTLPGLPEKNVIAFTGKMDYRPNVDAMLWFTGSILPLVRAEIPDVHLCIVGQQPHSRLDHLESMPGVTITGWVDSVLPYLHASDVYIAPLRMGSGTRLKLLEAMASGCAIVATSAASAGLRDEAKQAMIIADDERQFARQIVSLLQDEDRRGRLRWNARAHVQQYYDWSVLIPRLLDTYQEIGLNVG